MRFLRNAIACGFRLQPEGPDKHFHFANGSDTGADKLSALSCQKANGDVVAGGVRAVRPENLRTDS